jgi:pimeloyl-ACP methyl ester carboxylesterase
MFFELIPARLGLGSNPSDTTEWKNINHLPTVMPGTKKFVLCIGGFGMSATDTYATLVKQLKKLPTVDACAIDLPGTGNYSSYQSNEMEFFSQWLTGEVLPAIGNAGVEELVVVAFSMSSTLLASQDWNDLVKALSPCTLKGVALLSPSIRYRSKALAVISRALGNVSGLVELTRPVTKRVWTRMPENKSVAINAPAFHVWAPLYPLVSLAYWQHRLTSSSYGLLFGRVPVYIIQGVRDGKCNIEATKKWASSLRSKSVKRWWIEDSGHAVTLGRNSEAVCRILAEWCGEQLQVVQDSEVEVAAEG